MRREHDKGPACHAPVTSLSRHQPCRAPVSSPALSRPCRVSSLVLFVGVSRPRRVSDRGVARLSRLQVGMRCEHDRGPACRVPVAPLSRPCRVSSLVTRLSRLQVGMRCKHYGGLFIGRSAAEVPGGWGCFDQCLISLLTSVGPRAWPSFDHALTSWALTSVRLRFDQRLTSILTSDWPRFDQCLTTLLTGV